MRMVFFKEHNGCELLTYLQPLAGMLREVTGADLHPCLCM